MKSNTVSLVLSSLLLAAASTNALANDLWPGARILSPTPAGEGKTRVQVLAELEEARANGLIVSGEQLHTVYAPAIGESRSRNDVRAEAVQAIDMFYQHAGTVHMSAN